MFLDHSNCSRGGLITGVVAIVLVAAGGCVGGGRANGLEGKPAAEVQQAVAAALRDARTVHVTGTGIGADPAAQLDLRLQADISAVTGTLDGSPFEITTTGQDVHLKGDRAAWQALKAPPPVQEFAGRWMTLRAGQVELDIPSLADLTDLLTDDAWLGEPTVEQTTLDGQQVVVLGQSNGSRLYVANTGPAYPIRIEDASDGSRMDFTEHGVDFHLTPPGDALSNAFTTDESAWLDAVTALVWSMNEVFTNAPTHITSTSLAALADQLGGCGRELARLGSSTDRLQAAHTLVAQACTRYDEGARCFVTAADIGIPIGGSDADRRQTEALHCGFASSDAGTALGDAINKGNEIRAQVT